MEYFAGEYDIIIVGAGHAGCEAALACARLGLNTCVFSINLDSIANMPCNPSIGGTAKGHLVREIDALGGEMGRLADKTTLQSKMLNTAKGPAVFSLRAQIDRRMYQIKMKHILEKQNNLDIKQAEVISIIIKNNTLVGIKTHTEAIYNSKAVILTTGTYLKGRIIIGDINYSSGPDGIFPANRLSDSLIENNIELFRFKTGTPARVNKKSIDFNELKIQNGDENIVPFSFENETINIKQEPCWLTYTNEKTHQIIKKNLHRSPLYRGDIKGIGPRYCPSIEDKIVRFADKDRHQIFVEPMGIETEEMYLQGMSSSLPEDVQKKMVQSLPGFSKASIIRSAYAIEYDCINPKQLKLSLEFKTINGLYSAGQINGSSGYEEAAAQGLIAGINAANKILLKKPVIIKRSRGYIGVLIDDLITKGTNEPYRMMTSRAEYRLLLRQDNADMRLTPIGYENGLISNERYKNFLKKKVVIEKEVKRLRETVLKPNKKTITFLEKKKSALISTGIKLYELLKRPEIKYIDLFEIDDSMPNLSNAEKNQVEILIKYEGYIKKQLIQVEKFKKLENKGLSDSIKYTEIKGMRLEAIQKLENTKPISVGQASRISGVSPADISVLLVYLEQRRKQNN